MTGRGNNGLIPTWVAVVVLVVVVVGSAAFGLRGLVAKSDASDNRSSSYCEALSPSSPTGTNNC